jgi:hypothetical protein
MQTRYGLILGLLILAHSPDTAAQYCSKSPPLPPNPAVEGDAAAKGWGACPAEANAKCACTIHWHPGGTGEVLRENQALGAIEGHVKCAMGKGLYHIYVVKVDCTTVQGAALAPVNNNPVDTKIARPDCANAHLCCKGPITSDEKQTACKNAVGAAQIAAKCGNVFRVCNNGVATLKNNADKTAFCQNLAMSAHVKTTMETTFNVATGEDVP